MDEDLCNENTLRIVSVNRAVPIWTNIFLFLPSVLALSQTKNPTLVKFGIFGLIVSTISLLHHIYSNEDLKSKDLCKSKNIPEHTKFVQSLYKFDYVFAVVWGIFAIYLIVTSPIESRILQGTTVVLLIISFFFYFLANKNLKSALKNYKKLNHNNAISQENMMEYDLYHGFWHATLGMTLFIAVFLHM